MNIRDSIFWNHLYILLFFFKVKLSPNDKLFMELPIFLIEWSFLTIYKQIKKNYHLVIVAKLNINHIMN